MIFYMRIVDLFYAYIQQLLVVLLALTAVMAVDKTLGPQVLGKVGCYLLDDFLALGHGLSVEPIWDEGGVPDRGGEFFQHP